MSTEKNPYAKEDGTPKEGEFSEFFKWERAKELERISKLPKKEQDEILKAQEELFNRMNS